MKQTELEHSARVSGALFDDVLLPIAETMRATGAAPYFAAWRDATVSTYFSPSPIRRMTVADFEFPGGGTPDGLIDALAAYWSDSGDAALAAARPRLKEIAAALLVEAASDDGSVDIFCYTLF
jgi:hypothetical protein